LSFCGACLPLGGHEKSDRPELVSRLVALRGAPLWGVSEQLRALCTTLPHTGTDSVGRRRVPGALTGIDAVSATALQALPTQCILVEVDDCPRKLASAPGAWMLLARRGRDVAHRHGVLRSVGLANRGEMKTAPPVGSAEEDRFKVRATERQPWSPRRRGRHSTQPARRRPDLAPPRGRERRSLPEGSRPTAREAPSLRT
jgi:hypothetical protein